MRHIDFQFKRVDRYENVKLFFDDETLYDDFFVFDLNEIRFTFDKFRSKFDVFDSITIHHHFLVRQQVNAMTLNHDQQFFFCIWNVKNRARYVRYRMFVRVIKLLKNSISYDFMHIIFRNRILFENDKITINIIVDVLIRQSFFNRYKQNRKRNWSFNTTWHSSITMRFNRFWFSNRLKKQKKSSIKTNSNVININWISFDELWKFHSRQRMSTFWYFCRKFCDNAIKKTIIRVSINFRSQTHVVEFTIVIFFAL